MITAIIKKIPFYRVINQKRKYTNKFLCHFKIIFMLFWHLFRIIIKLVNIIFLYSLIQIKFYYFVANFFNDENSQQKQTHMGVAYYDHECKYKYKSFITMSFVLFLLFFF